MGYCEAPYKVLEERHHSVKMSHCAKDKAWSGKEDQYKEGNLQPRV